MPPPDENDVGDIEAGTPRARPVDVVRVAQEALDPDTRPLWITGVDAQLTPRAADARSGAGEDGTWC